MNARPVVVVFDRLVVVVGVGVEERLGWGSVLGCAPLERPRPGPVHEAVRESNRVLAEVPPGPPAEAGVQPTTQSSIAGIAGQRHPLGKRLVRRAES